jgi:hypothetical protein
MARPIIPQSEIRKRFHIYLSEEERADIERKAAEANLPLSMFMRKAALGQRCQSIPAINCHQWAELGRMAANLNQIAKHLNEGDPFSVSDAISMDELRFFLGDIRLALTGKGLDSQDR